MDPCNEHASHSKLRIGAGWFIMWQGGEKTEREMKTHTHTHVQHIDNEFESIQPKASQQRGFD